MLTPFCLFVLLKLVVDLCALGSVLSPLESTEGQRMAGAAGAVHGALSRPFPVTPAVILLGAAPLLRHARINHRMNSELQKNRDANAMFEIIYIISGQWHPPEIPQ